MKFGAAKAQAMSKSTSISGAMVVDADAAVARGPVDLSIREGRIESLWESTGPPPPGSIDARGVYLCPGLIDAHVHLFLDAGLSPREAFLNGGDESKLATASKNAAIAIAAGITTVRDCGGPAELLFRFREAVNCGITPGPRILAAGSPLTRPQGHCHFFGIEIGTPAEARRAVDSQLRLGAEFIKLIASGGGLTPGTRPSEADLPLAIMREAAGVAHANGVQVAAHCHAVESIARALQAGVDIIEHASFVLPEGPPRFDPELAAQLRDEGVAVSPTAISGIRIAQTIRESGTQNGHDRDAVVRLESRRRHIAHFREAGVRLLAGTDCGVARTSFDSLADELREYVDAGMSAADALRSATSDSARILNQPGLGRIAPGCFADLLLLAGNPLESIDHLRNPLLVMKEGEIVCDFRAASLNVS